MYGRSEYSLPPSSASKSDISASPIRPAATTAAGAAAYRGRPPAAPQVLSGALRSPSPGAAHAPEAGSQLRRGGGVFLHGDLPVQDQLDALKSALLVTMEELDTLRRDTAVDNGKLQMEFRRSIDALLSASESQLLGAAATSQRNAAPTYGEPSLSHSALREVVSRLDYLENTLRLVQSNQSASSRFPSTAAAAEHAMAPVAVESALRRMAEFMDRADEDIRSAAATNARAVESWEARFASLQREHDDVIKRMMQQQVHLEEQLEIKTRAIMSPGHEARVNGRSLDGTIDNSASAPSGGGGGNERLTASAFVTLSQVSNIVNSQIVEVAALMDAEIAKMKESMAHHKLDRTQIAQKLDRVAETVSQLDEEAREMRRDTELHLKEITKTSATAEEFLKRIEGFVENFTLQESANIRDEVLRLVNSDAAVAQRKIEDRHRRDETTSVKQDIIRTVTALERLQEEVTRVTAQQQSLHQAFERTAHTVQSVQHKVDTELRSQVQRMEQQQKSFHERQTQQLMSERHNMVMKVQEDLRRLQDKHLEELAASEQRRLDDVTNAAQQIREDFASFVETQRREQLSTISKVKEDFATATKLANETLHRNMITTRDEHKRAIDRTIDEYRKLSAHTQDELHRMQHQLEDVSAMVKDQSNFARARVEQLMEQAQSRIDNTADEIANKLNAVVEAEVKQVTNAAMKNALNKITALDDATTNTLKGIREETKSLKATIDAIAIPSNSIKTVDERVDGVRADITTLFAQLAQLQNQETRLIARAREEANSAVENSRSYIQRTVIQQISSLEKDVGKLRTELDVRGTELKVVAARVEGLHSTILYPRGGDAMGVAQAHEAFYYQQQQQPSMRSATAGSNAALNNSAANASRAAVVRGLDMDQQQRSAFNSFFASPPGADRVPSAQQQQQQQQQGAAASARQPSYRSASSSSAVGFVLPTPGGGHYPMHHAASSPTVAASTTGEVFTPSPGNRGTGSRGGAGGADALFGAFDSF